MIQDWHPLIVHFPIALVFLAWVFQSIHMAKPTWISAQVPLITTLFSTLAGIAAAITGDKQASTLLQSVDPKLSEFILQHQSWGNGVLWGLIIGSILWGYLYLKKWNPATLRWFAWLYLLSMMILVSITGFLGGELVFVHHLGLWN